MIKPKWMTLSRLVLPAFMLWLATSGQGLYAQGRSAASSRARWFTDARFGMFIHWGLYSGAEGIWKGERHRYMNNYAEWIRYRNRIPAELYGQLAERFVWDEIDPEEWVLMAKQAGMKYIIITAKHHDGVAVWDTQVDGNSLPRLSGVRRDPIAELAAACRKHGMKLGFYYSHWIDWAHPGAWDHNQELTGRVTDAQYNQYWQAKVIPQLRELLTNYGEIAILWFDMWIPHEQTIVKREQLLQVIDLVRTLQPNCLINSRLGLPPDHPGIDFETMGDNQFGWAYRDYPWETPGTIAHSWGYNALENEWKSTSQLLQSLISNVSLNGGFTLNIGPRADGHVPYEGVRRLEDIGRWLAINGDAIYGCDGTPLRATQHDWGRLTHKTLTNGRERLYVHVFNWPLDTILRITGITSAPKQVYLLQDKLAEEIPFTQKGPILHLHTPRVAPDPFVSVVVLEFDGPIVYDHEVVAESSFGGLSLRGNNLLEWPVGIRLVPYDGLRPEHLVIDQPTVLRWKVYVNQSQSVRLDISYSNQAAGAAEVKVSGAGQQVTGELMHTGKVVAEPNQQFYTDEFREQPLGSITFADGGYYEITIQLTPPEGGQLLFNRLWIE